MIKEHSRHLFSPFNTLMERKYIVKDAGLLQEDHRPVLQYYALRHPPHWQRSPPLLESSITLLQLEHESPTEAVKSADVGGSVVPRGRKEQRAID